MIFNTLIKSGITGKPIEVTELPIPTEKDIDKVYLLKTEEKKYLPPVIGKSLGNKIYFDTNKNPLDYTDNLGILIRVENNETYYDLALVDILDMLNITDSGHAYVLGVADGDLNLLGLSYIYCDVLTVDQFNANIGSQFGVSISSFGWLTNEIDTSSIADWTVTRNLLTNYGNLAYTDIEVKEIETYYKVDKIEGKPIEVGKPVPNTIICDTSKTPEFGNVATSEPVIYFSTKDPSAIDEATVVCIGIEYPDEVTENNGTMQLFGIQTGGTVPIALLYVGGTASLETVNAMLGDSGINVTQKGWQYDGRVDDLLKLATDNFAALGAPADVLAELAALLAQPLVYVNDPQGIFIAEDQYVFEELSGKGFPIEVATLPTPTEDDVNKIYLLKKEEKEYIYPVVGQAIGDKIYFDTNVNPLDYIGDTPFHEIFATDNYFLAFADFFGIEGITDSGQCWVIAMCDTEGTPIANGVVYAYCDVLTVDQFNANIGSQFGFSITEFGWQGDVVDTTSIATEAITENNLASYGNIAYTDFEIKQSEEYYKVNKIEGIPIEVGKPVPNILHYDMSVTPDFSNVPADGSGGITYFATNEQYILGMAGIIPEDATENQGTIEMVALQLMNQYPIILYVDGTASLETMNSMFGPLGINIAQKGWQGNGTVNITDEAIKLGTAVGAIESILAAGLADPVTTFNDPQGIFIAEDQYVFETLGSNGFPIEVSVLPEATEENKGKVYLLTPTNEYYECSNAPLVVGQPVGTVIAYDTSKTPTFTTAGVYYLNSKPEILVIVGIYLSSEDNNGEGDIRLIVAVLSGANKVLYADGSASIEFINSQLQSLGVEAITTKGWQGDGTLNLIDWVVEANGGNQTAEELKQAEEMLNTTVLIEEANDTEGIFSKGPGIVLINEAGIRKDFEEQIESQEAQINTLTSEKANLSEQLSNMINRVATHSYKFNTERGAIYPYEFTGWDGGQYAAVVVPNGMLLREYAFYKSNINEIGLYSSITDIPEHCFEESSTWVSLPANVTNVGEKAFFGNKRISQINIPATLTTIGEEAFAKMPSLREFNVDSGNSKFEVVDGALCYKDGAVICLPANQSVTEFLAPTRRVESYAFAGNLNLKTVSIRGVSTNDVKGVFEGCNRLESVTIDSLSSNSSKDTYSFPYSVKSITATCSMSIGDGMFMDLENVTQINLSYDYADFSMYRVGVSAFQGCKSLKNLNLDWPGFYIIEDSACEGCESLTDVTLGQNIVAIGPFAFLDCKALTNISLPPSLQTILPYAFYQCNALKQISLPDSLAVLEDYSLYVTGLTSLNIPDSIRYIGHQALSYCKSLTNVTIGSGIKEIGNWAFSEDTALLTVVVKATTPPKAGSEIFSMCSEGLSIYVPLASIDAYKTAAKWSVYASQIYPYIETEAELSSIDTTAYTKANVGGMVYNYVDGAWTVEA